MSKKSNKRDIICNDNITHLIKFAVIGVLGFVIDFIILFVLVKFFDSNPIYSRVPSIIIAMGVTWFCNRCYSFSSNDPRIVAEAIRFMIVNVIGGCINFTIYSLIIWLLPIIPILLAVIISTLFSMCWNYFGNRVFVFVDSKYHINLNGDN